MSQDPILNAVLDITADTRVMPNPEKFDLDALIFGWRLCAVDQTSQHGFRWPWPGNWAHADGPFIGNGACPYQVGDGICIAKNLPGASSGGQRVGASTGLLVAFYAEDVLGQDDTKVRVRAAWVADTFNPVRAVCASKCHLTHADLTHANLAGAALAGADLRRANLVGANLRDADLTHADLAGANLRGADLTAAALTVVNLRGANLVGVNLTDANLTGANLTGAYLRGANLTDANLNGAYLTDADLRGAIRWNRI